MGNKIAGGVLVLAFILLGLPGCADRQAETELADLKARVEAEAELLEANKAVIRRTHAEVWSKGRLDIVDELYSPEYVSHWADGGVSDRAGLKKMIAEARAAFPDLKEEIVHIVAEDDLVVTYFISSGTFTGQMNGIPPTGKSGSRPEIAVHRIENGKIVEQWTVADQMTLLNQLGIEL